MGPSRGINRKIIRLNELAKRTGLSVQSITDSLSRAGYNVPLNNPRIYLYRSQLKVLSGAFVQAVKEYQSRLRATHIYLNSEELAKAENFLSQFIDDPSPLYGNASILHSSLNQNRIRDFFDWLITVEPADTSFRNLRIVLKNIKLRVVKVCNTYKRKILTQLISNHYYIFSCDEEPSREAYIQSRFSVVTNALGGAIDKSVTQIKNILEWKKYKYQLLLST